jgi:hypothetical protein
MSRPERDEMPKTPISRAELEAHLNEQLAFIERSAASFDEGFEDEAKRLAHTIRVLVHDSNNSHSVLKQLDLKRGMFLDSALPFFDASPLSYHGLISAGGHGKKADFQAMLDEAPGHRQLPFEDWWNAPVIVDQKGHQFSRRDIILTAANQDGGSHVDPRLDDAYAALAKQNSLSWFSIKSDGKAEPIPSPERDTIRQIAHELLKTLKRGYHKAPKPVVPGEIRIAGAKLNFIPASSPPPSKMGRNERCFCGSGRKYKHCHGRLA